MLEIRVGKSIFNWIAASMKNYAFAFFVYFNTPELIIHGEADWISFHYEWIYNIECLLLLFSMLLNAAAKFLFMKNVLSYMGWLCYIIEVVWVGNGLLIKIWNFLKLWKRAISAIHQPNTYKCIAHIEPVSQLSALIKAQNFIMKLD